eukprot:5734060-Amphidinium_carterae.2
MHFVLTGYGMETNHGDKSVERLPKHANTLDTLGNPRARLANKNSKDSIKRVQTLWAWLGMQQCQKTKPRIIRFVCKSCCSHRASLTASESWYRSTFCTRASHGNRVEHSAPHLVRGLHLDVARTCQARANAKSVTSMVRTRNFFTCFSCTAENLVAAVRPQRVSFRRRSRSRAATSAMILPHSAVFDNHMSVMLLMLYKDNE